MYYEHRLDGTTRLFEEYAIKGKWSRRNEIGTWSEENGFEIGAPNIWERRGNLTGIVLYNSILRYWPVTLVVRNEHGDIVDSDGFLPQLLFSLRQFDQYLG